jgi:late competence protein required for DNA uptake (superfamily II DNA/RNA helicase)
LIALQAVSGSGKTNTIYQEQPKICTPFTFLLWLANDGKTVVESMAAQLTKDLQDGSQIVIYQDEEQYTIQQMKNPPFVVAHDESQVLLREFPDKFFYWNHRNNLIEKGKLMNGTTILAKFDCNIPCWY